jgi:hypothetical protein
LVIGLFSNGEVSPLVTPPERSDRWTKEAENLFERSEFFSARPAVV